MLLAALSIGLASSFAPSTLARQASTGHFTLSPSDPELGPMLLAEIDLRRGYPTEGIWCPPGDGIYLCNGIYKHRGTIRARLGNSADLDPMRQSETFRKVGGHAVRRERGGRMVAMIEQTDKGDWFVHWNTPVVGGQICVPEPCLEFYGVTSDLPYTTNAEGSRCFSLRDAKRR